jgi:hypothetical protein
MPKQVVLRVFANPFCAGLDHEGRPHGHVRHEPPRDGGSATAQPPFLGCHLIATPKRAGDAGVPAPGTKLHHVMKVGDQSDYDHVWEYETEPTIVPLTPYYLSLLRQHGEHGAALLCADLQTHAIVFGTREGFHPPQARLHRYVMERGATPRLRLNAEQHTVFTAKLAVDPKHERDHAAEWDEFVGEHASHFPEPEFREGYGPSAHVTE